MSLDNKLLIVDVSVAAICLLLWTLPVSSIYYDLEGNSNGKDQYSGTTTADQNTIINSIGMEFVQIPAGEFDMGSPSNEARRWDDEGPVHHVKISNAFYMGKYEVTQKQWQEIMGTNPSNFKGDKLPVEQVSWNDVQNFIKKLNEKEGGSKYRLPTEAEWEYAARAGTTMRFSFGDDESILGDYAWYNANSGSKTHDVGQKKPNPWGLYDMYGNIWEWVQDIYHNSYNGAPIDGSSWEGNVSERVIRGGDWPDYVGCCRSADRSADDPGGRYYYLGFRLVMVLQTTSTNTPMPVPANTPTDQISTPTDIATQQPPPSDLNLGKWTTIEMSTGLNGGGQGGGVWYGPYKYLDFSETDKGRILQVDVQSNGQSLRIELWGGMIEQNDHYWWTTHSQEAVSTGTGDKPQIELNPQLRWTIKPGKYTLFFAGWDSNKVVPYTISYKTEISGTINEEPMKTEYLQKNITSSTDMVPTTYLSYVNNELGFYKVRNLDKQPRNFAYENSVLNINQGDTVIWENDEGKETLNIISDQELWNNEIGQIKAGRRINYTFYYLGTYTFHIVFEGSLKRQTIVVTQTDSQISIPISTDKNTFTNSIGMEFVQIPAGEFDMGSPSNEAERYDSEGPVHHVKISNAFYMGKYEVTQKQWRDVMGTTPSFYKGDDLPVERVSWNEVQDFITKLNEEEGANKYRLPTEAEWEYAARAGTTSRYSFGDDESMLGNYAWCNSNSGNSGIKTQGVGQKKPNPWGLYDMNGNVFEWTQDNWHSDYNGAPTDGSSWESRDIFDRVSRGGSWGSDAKGCTSTVRYAPDDASSEVLGFRLLRIS